MKARTKRQNAAKPKPVSGESSKSRDEVLSDFRKIAGPLRGRNRDRKPKP